MYHRIDQHGFYLGISSDTNEGMEFYTQVPISANEFVVGDFMKTFFDFEKNDNTDNATVRIRVGTTGTTSDTLMATFLSNQRYFSISREKNQFLTGNLLKCLNPPAGSQLDTIATSAFNNISITPSGSWIMSISVQLANGDDMVSCVGYRVSKIKTF